MPNSANPAQVVENWASNIVDYALLLAAIATLVMALIELAKAITNARPRFHRKEVRQWIGAGAAYEQLLVLSVSSVSGDDALFDQPTDKMMGQIQAAGNVAIEFPAAYPDLYRLLTEPPRPKSAPPATEPNDADEWLEFARRIEAPVGGEADPAFVTRATRARARLDHFMSRKLDAFQTRTEYKWARANQYLAVFSATVFLLVLLSELRTSNPLLWGLTSVFGGLVSPLAKDVASALSGLRARRA